MVRILPFLVLACGSLPAQEPPTPVDLDEHEHSSMREVVDRAGHTLDDWIDRFRLSGFVAARYFDTEARGSRPDGALGIGAATLFVDADVRNVGSVFLELRLDYFQEAGQNAVGIGEAYMRFGDVFGSGGDHGVGLKVGRFDLPFGEYYNYEDPDRNRLVGFPAAIPYRWDEGVLAFADCGAWGFTAAFTDGTASRNSSSGIAPAATLRLHSRPSEELYLSASGMYIHSADLSSICFGGSVITPVTGSASGSSPSAEVRSSLGSLDADWQLLERVHLQVSAGGGRVDDDADAFDRTIVWWMLEPTVILAPGWDTTLRWSGAGTFDRRKGFQFEGRPYANGAASYGFDLSQLQRVQLGLRHTFAPGLIGKVEVGFDHLVATDVSALPDDTRLFTAAELVLSF
ncbi:MAG TPA: hypothetical protein VFZ65_12910 [Planctomycetota bacterium]|nr:hypothetical protein [Planctomycetota bacterium]